ncbi:MAG: type IX secretion system sortase PorU [Dysgonamonadaceae bacterium]|jgi:hypothetical protein|nr:type IX secretion system sortase PorU [Dysgonamonadaceae bacterium]
MKINKTYLAIGIATACHIIFSCSTQAKNDASRYAKNSVLSSGKWIQIQVNENGIYKLTYEDIKKMGINDPAKVKIFGYGGWILSENFTKSYIDDLPEVAVWMNKGSDGVFNAGDFLLFYGRGPIKWAYNESSDFYEHENNPYATLGSYFLTESTDGPKIMQVLNSSSVPATAVNLTTFDDYAVYEKDEREIITSGRLLFGESFVGKNTQKFSFSIPGITSDPGNLRISFAASPLKGNPVNLSVSIENQELLNLPIQPPSNEYEKAKLVNHTANWVGEKKEQVVATINYNADGQTAAYLDYIVLNMKRRLQFYNTGYTFFRNKENLFSDVKYIIDNANEQSLVWDITSNYEAMIMNVVREGNKLSFETPKDDVLHEYVMVDYSKSFPVPTLIGEINNQDLHGLQKIDYVIIAPEVYFTQAGLLAERHRNAGLNVVVVQPEWVYNEFSSGTPDATAYRRFMKMFYDRATTEEEKPKYLLLFGDGIFDNRHLTKLGTKIDSRYYLLTFQMKSSVDERTSYGTDDYFGFLDDNEGVTFSSDRLDIGIGRFPVSSVNQAENVVQKIVAYMDDTYKTEWKNKIISTADNADLNSSPTHGNHAKTIANYIEVNHPQYMITKSYMDVFKPVTLNGKTTFPEAKKKFLTALSEGCFLLNYTGHGSKTAWSAEDMLNIVDVRKMDFEGLPLWITATCDFGWFDGIDTSGGEEAFLNKKGGAIALYTTSRVVVTINNLYINERLVKNIFSKPNGKRLRLGDILRISKNEMGTDANKLNYVLLGDPGLKLNYPEFNVEVKKINGETVDNDKTYVFKALDNIVLEGEITDAGGSLVPDFNGYMKTTVFDSKQTVKGFSPYPTVNDTSYFTYVDYPNRVFIGDDSIKNGKFSISFTVPLDISYTKEKGKINFYAYDENSNRDANGYYLNYMLFGSNDTNGDTGFPEIRKLFLNSESFESGDNVNETPFFVARVYDAKGINMSGNGLGHDITICIDGSPTTTYSLNSYYVPVDKNEGEIKFSIPEIAPGKHQLAFKVWNILNRSSSDSIYFNVVKGLKPNLYDITATNIPAREFTKFRLLHDRPESTIDVEIFVYDLTGRTVWSHKETGSSSWLKQYDIEWNLINGFGTRVEQGIYVYRAIIRTPEGDEATKAKKLIILKQ